MIDLLGMRAMRKRLKAYEDQLDEVFNRASDLALDVCVINGVGYWEDIENEDQRLIAEKALEIASIADEQREI